MSEIEALRNTILIESDPLGNKKRFGLFSSPISTALGDDGPYKTKLHPKNQQGKPQTAPRGIYTNPPRTGQLNKSNFAPINSLAAGEIKDQYIDPDRKLLLIYNEKFKKGYKKQQMFKPASCYQEVVTPSYGYQQQNPPELNPKRNRQEDGKVKAQLKNITSNPQSNVIKSYFKPIKYIQDPYERAKQLSFENLKKNKSLQPQAQFKQNLHPKDTFNKDKVVFGSDVQFPQKKIRNPKFNIMKHQARWKDTHPNKSGHQGYFTAFPFYKEDPPIQKTRRTNEQNKKQPFRRMSIAHSKPSPSISCNRFNLSLSKTISFSFRKK